MNYRKLIDTVYLCMQHMDRTFHNVTGDVTYSDSGMFMFPFDRIGLSYMKQLVPSLSHSINVNCDDVPYCGWPFYLPVIHFSPPEYVTVCMSVCLSVCLSFSRSVVHFISRIYTSYSLMTHGAIKICFNYLHQ